MTQTATPATPAAAQLYGARRLSAALHKLAASLDPATPRR